MSEELQNTQEEAVNSTEETTSEETIGEIINEPEEKAPKVGLDKFLEIKKENKELREQLDSLAKRIERGDDKQEVSDDLEALADEHNIDRSFLSKLVKSIEKNADKRIEETLNQRIAPFTQKEKEARISEAFSKAFEKTIENLPEFKDIVNPDVIKALSLDPQNAKKTFTQLIEETYGKAITGKRTIETTKPGGGKEPQDLDFNRANSDQEYFKEVMANPSLKSKYNEKSLNEVSKYL